MPIHADVDQHGEVEPDRARLEPHDALADDAGLLELMDAARARRRGQADAVGDLLIAEPAVGLQLGEDLEIERVEFCASFGNNIAN